MNLTIVITLCVLLVVVLILFPLIISRRAQDMAKEKSEWDKIKEFGEKINKKTKKDN
jgi:uncharacterized membrane protein|tara:strand:+ start:230 stop:400 length:171 start_codon:yes stop_codon:yes gene_type:complete